MFGRFRNMPYLCNMKRLVNELGVIAIATIFLLSLLQPFGIDQMGKQRMLLIVCGTLLTILSSSIAFMLIGRKKWSNVRGLLLFHVVNIPLLSAMVLTLLSWFTWDSLTKGWYCTAGEFSVINYLKVCVEVALLSFFIQFPANHHEATEGKPKPISIYYSLPSGFPGQSQFCGVTLRTPVNRLLSTDVPGREAHTCSPLIYEGYSRQATGRMI